MDRLAIARKTLEEAEQKAGLNIVRTMPHTGARANPHTGVSGELSSDHYNVPAYLQGTLPAGIPRRGVLSIRGSHFFITVLASIASEHNAWIAFLGVPDVGWACAESLGVVGARVVHVPRIEVQASQVISAAIDGFDIVIVGNVRLDARERRVLHRRAISKGALILAMNWPNATFTVDCELLALSGLNGGAGHIKSVDYLVSSQHGQSYIRYHGSRTARALEPLHDAHGNVGRSVTPYLNAVPDRIPS